MDKAWLGENLFTTDAQMILNSLNKIIYKHTDDFHKSKFKKKRPKFLDLGWFWFYGSRYIFQMIFYVKLI